MTCRLCGHTIRLVYLVRSGHWVLAPHGPRGRRCPGSGR